jgi:hypothetical protein
MEVHQLVFPNLDLVRNISEPRNLTHDLMGDEILLRHRQPDVIVLDFDQRLPAKRRIRHPLDSSEKIDRHPEVHPVRHYQDIKAGKKPAKLPSSL